MGLIPSYPPASSILIAIPWQTQLRTITTDFVLADYILALRNIYDSCYTTHDAYIGNLRGALESIDNGTTYLVDHSHIMNTAEHAEAAVKGLRDAKIRAVFCYALYGNPPWEGSCVDTVREQKTPNWRLDDAVRIRKTLFPSNLPDELVRFGFAPSEPDVTPIDTLAHDIEVARSLGAAVITSHISLGKYDAGNVVVRKLGRKGLLGTWS
jgi:cytosine/adenosine deaminase-related metal-dependent hydrolase